MRDSFVKRGLPVMSVDTKEKGLVGNFKNAGTAWQREAVPVNDHELHFDADGIAIPYGVYDIQANLGSVLVGASHDTPQFAVDDPEKWRR